MGTPELWLIAGPNGAGKTTSTQKEPLVNLLPRIVCLNPDDRTRAKLRAAGYNGFADAPLEVQTPLFLESANEVAAELERAIARDERIAVETVLSSDKYQRLVEAVLARGGKVGLLYVALQSSAIAQRRVANRVILGGHSVPEEKIAARWLRSLEYLAWYAVRVTQFWVVDNSDEDPDQPPQLIAYGRSGRLEFLADEAFPEMKSALASLPR
jgi:predicted ABC-type ATPase